MRRLLQLWRDEEGPTAVEYALMAAAIAGVIVAVVFFFGGKTKNTFQNVADRYPG